MKRFKLWNNIVGWLVFAVAATTYLLTIEPTASFWDCGEFIASAFKLEVGHPPGAPFFMMTARLFTLLASDPSQVAPLVNAMSALCSAFTILFLFWTITHLARKVLVPNAEESISTAKFIAIIGAGMVGALAYTFSDTFWFSAVEGEVYAYSSFFTAVVFWLILKWEDSEVDSPTSDRWLILIAYLMGLSIGVHLLNLLAIPAIVLVYYFKKYTPNFKGVCVALAASVAILAAVLYGLIPGFVKVASWFELLFTNVLGCPFNTGLIIYMVLAIAALVWAVYETQFGTNAVRAKIAFVVALTLIGVPFLGDGIVLGVLIIVALCLFLFLYKHVSRRWMNTVVLCATVMLIGYASYAMIVIRSMANTPMDQNSPEDVFSLQYYLNREQYGDRPLFYGAVYSAPEKLTVQGNVCVPEEKEGSPIWICKEKTEPGEKDQYVVAGYRHRGYKMDERFMMLFPRMYSTQGSHVEAYKSWANIKGKRIEVDRCGRKEKIVCPTFGENLRFFFGYQLNFMYWRYFMWNFSGRQNDIQGHGELDHGNWITGFDFIDNAMLCDQSHMPDSLKNNKGHNRYFMLPLLLGILGIVWQLAGGKKGTQSFWVTFTLFFMTGIAIVMYLNQTPYQPRERDYAYAGSFYAFCIWIGLGVLAVAQGLGKVLPKSLAAIFATLFCLGVPALMAQQNWDDHDRSGRYTCRDFGANYLNSCAPNAIYFCNGDNDTFPVWYNMEVEGTRTDMRACNLSYLSTDWYIDQMKRGAYESAPLPITWERKDYVSGHLDVSRVIDHPQFGGSMPLEQALDLVRVPELIDDGIGNMFASNMEVPVDKDQVLATGTVKPEDADKIVDTMNIKLNRIVEKSQMMVLEMIHSNNWERPMYFAVTVGEQFYPNIKNYLQLEGLCYRLVPIDNGGREKVNTEAMYDNLMHKFRFGGIENPDIYIDENLMRMCRTHRMMFASLVEALIDEGQNDKALEVLDYCMQVIPPTTVPHDYTSVMLADAYYTLGENAKGDNITGAFAAELYQRLDWIQSLPEKDRNRLSREMGAQQNLGMLHNLYYICADNARPLADDIRSRFEKYYLMAQ
ncbi:MAG: DUF2723 domain-containing protein [Bacteroidales bacterium]|nr:DUF2723 domain-containing protein [Bacteroidales bacterium]MDY4851198.1 DUF2723 domain-containing protein [Paludibacteraceae bacterium]MDY6037234.1 DUF2723 domain-containing protein [Paludibacteraceae bacterium]